MWNLRNKTEEHGEERGKKNKLKSERETNCKRLTLNHGNKPRVAGGEEGGEMG